MDKQYGVENIVSYRLVDHYSFISQPSLAPLLILYPKNTHLRPPNDSPCSAKVSYRLVDHYSFLSRLLPARLLHPVSEKYTSPPPK